MSEYEYKDFYEILKISRNASAYEIRAASRKLALKYHPDKNKAPTAIERFREVRKAYECLIDKKKRDVYDKENPIIVPDQLIEYDLHLSLEEVNKGCTKNMKICRRVIQPDGSFKKEEKVLIINIKPGCEAGTKFTFLRQGDKLKNEIPADVVFIVRDKPHTLFTREGSDIRYIVKIILVNKHQGSSRSTISVPTLSGKKVQISLSNVIMKPNSPTVQRIRGLGLPCPDEPNRKGDLIISFDIKYKH